MKSPIILALDTKDIDLAQKWILACLDRVDHFKVGLEFYSQHGPVGIERLRRRFGSLWIDKERCAYFLKALKQYRKEWDDKMGKFKNKPLHDWSSHAGDIIRYWAITPELYKGELKFSY